MRRVEVSPDAQALADRVARALVEAVAAGHGERFTVALSGGSTPRLLYRRLAEPDLRQKVDWSQVELFFGDERAVPSGHADSNFRMAEEALLRHLPPGARAWPMPAADGDAEAYQQRIWDRVTMGRGAAPRFDLVLLGIGTDGHTASLFPGTAALAETRRLVVMNEVPQLATRRMTFTYPLINAAARVWVLAAGADKRPVLEDLFHRAQPAYPIRGVAPHSGELVFWLDRAAAPQREGEGA